MSQFLHSHSSGSQPFSVDYNSRLMKLDEVHLIDIGVDILLLGLQDGNELSVCLLHGAGALSSSTRAPP